MNGATPAAAATPHPRACILTVDDDSLTRAVFAMVLGGDYEVVGAASADEAEKLLGEREFDLVLCDIVMEGRSGLELLRDAGVLERQLAVIMVTSLDRPEVAEQALAAGADGYLVKPFTNNALLITVISALRRRAAERAAREAERSLRQEQLRTEQQRVALEVYATVMHDLIRVGLELTGTAGLVEQPEVQERLTRAVADIDSILKRARTSLFAPPRVDP
ncbi:MAG: response regulator [Sporichthyaceae bacterium]